MSAVSRVSAFAKRRRLNDDSAVPISESDGSSTISFTKAVKSRKITVRKLDTAKESRQKLSLDETEPFDGTNVASENSFEPLVDAKAVSFIGTREIEQLDGNGCKIRLTRGQKCSLHGIARVWVREGSVHVDGALLSESAIIHTAFSSAAGSFADIIARSKIAEIYLESIQSTDKSLPSTVNVPGKLGELARNGAMSFRVLGQDQDEDKSSPETASEIDFRVKRTLPYLLSASEVENPQILVCGKRSADTYRASTSLVNHLLTDSSKGLASHVANKVAFLDLDFIAPAFSAPGTICVNILQRPILGPSYTQPLQQHPKQSNRILAVQYVGAIETSGRPRIDLNCINALLSTAKKATRDQILVIRTGSWLAHMTQPEQVQLQKLLSIDIAVCVDSNKASPNYEIAQTISGGDSDTFFHLPMIPCATSSLSEHKLTLQSHFRLCEFVDDIPFWYHEPIPNTQGRRLALSTDESNNEISFLQVRGGMLRPQDIPSAIYQNLVVIVAMSAAKDSESSLPNHHSGSRQDLSNGRDSARQFLKLRDADDTQPLHYIGLAYVEGIEIHKRTITLNTPVSMEDIQKYASVAHEVGLVLEKAGPDGRFGRHLLFS